MVQKAYLKTKDVCKVKFTVDLPDAETVEIVGLNNDWDAPVALSKKKNGTFVGEVPLPKNTKHEFKYRVNNSEWMNEPEADGQKPNEFGGENSVIVL